MYGKARLTMNRSRLDMNTASDSTPTTAVTRRASGGVELTNPPQGKAEIWTNLNPELPNASRNPTDEVSYVSWLVSRPNLGAAQSPARWTSSARSGRRWPG